MILHGKVGDGQGHASGDEWLGSPLFTALLGPIYAASLNVFVPGIHDYAPNTSNYPKAEYIRQQGYLAVRRCKLNEVEAFILRNESPGPTFPNKRPPPIPPPHTMFEIVARSFIQNAGYWADVTIEFEPGHEHLRRLPLR